MRYTEYNWNRGPPADQAAALTLLNGESGAGYIAAVWQMMWRKAENTVNTDVETGREHCQHRCGDRPRTLSTQMWRQAENTVNPADVETGREKC
jgi:hypothetical protein